MVGIAIFICLYLITSGIVAFIMDIADRKKVSSTWSRPKKGQPIKVNRRKPLGIKGQYN